MNWFLISLLLLPLVLPAQLKMASIFSSNMVLQRDQPLRLWGRATPGQTVMVQFHQQRRTAIVQNDSAWMVSFPPQKRNAVAQSITITSGAETVRLDNLLFGDVWIASGQSNMEWPVRREMHWQDEKSRANQPLIRLNNPPFSSPHNPGLCRR